MSNSKKRNPNEKFQSKIGGQALIEGIMMKGPDTAAMACRLPSGEIDLEQWAVRNGKNAPWYRKCPLIRGSVVFVQSMIEGYRCLTKSAEKQGDFEEEEMSPFEQKLNRLFGDKLMTVVSGVGIVFGVLLSVALFLYVPMLVTSLLGEALSNGFVKALVEGLIKITLFVGYLWATSRMKEIRRTFMYHGAEHKTITCYESDLPLTVENVRPQCRFHPRCGTSFLILTLIVSILVFTMVTWKTLWMRIILKILLLPVVCGISYELIRLAGKYENPITRIISAPGMALQHLTTVEPEDDMIECAIAALKPCIPENQEDDQW